MVIATPIRDQSAQTVGVLAARLNLRGFFRLIDDRIALGKSGETVVGKLIGSGITFMAPTRHDPEAAMKRSVPLGSELATAMQRAVRREVGVGRVLDYRGRCVYAGWQHLRALDWALTVKIDCDEALAPFDRTRSRTVILAIGLMLLALVSSVVAARALVRPLRELKNAADRISKGDFDVQLRARSGDEIGDLAESFERMVAAIKFFREHSRKEEDEVDADAPGETAAGDEGKP
jgi:HAMP domain-containing protein